MNDIGWRIEPVSDIDGLEPGRDYIIRMVTTDDRFWAKGVITVSDKWIEDEMPCVSFRLHSLIDGSPGILDGWDGND